MKSRTQRDRWIRVFVPLVLLAIGCFTADTAAQNPELLQKVAEIKEASARNKQALAQYT